MQLRVANSQQKRLRSGWKHKKKTELQKEARFLLYFKVFINPDDTLQRDIYLGEFAFVCVGGGEENDRLRRQAARILMARCIAPSPLCAENLPQATFLFAQTLPSSILP